jgi:hypothetical protein
MMKYTAAPLPFQGQKRRVLKPFEKIIFHSKASCIVDVFGGSGLLAHCAKKVRPDATVIYNDYDNYCVRLGSIPTTNAILNDIRKLNLPKIKERIPENLKSEIITIVKKYDELEPLDYITLSSNLLFSMNYAVNLEDLTKQTLYNRVTFKEYRSTDYLKDVKTTRTDYKALIEEYKGIKPLYILDPPYLSTDNTTYTNTSYWRLSDYLDILLWLKDEKFIYFSSNKSEIVELAQWLGNNISRSANPFNDCNVVNSGATASHNSKYTDILIHNITIPTNGNQQKLELF